MSESETRSVVAIGNSRVILAKAGIQVSVAAMTRQHLGPGLRWGDGSFVIPAKAGIQLHCAREKWVPVSAGTTGRLLSVALLSSF
jgi:hypothetical protein